MAINVATCCILSGAACLILNSCNPTCCCGLPKPVGVGLCASSVLCFSSFFLTNKEEVENSKRILNHNLDNNPLSQLYATKDILESLDDAFNYGYYPECEKPFKFFDKLTSKSINKND